MKKLLYLLVMPLLAIISCEKPEPEPEPVVGKITLQSEASYVFSDEGESHQVAFEATLDWEAAASEDFVIVEPKSGLAVLSTSDSYTRCTRLVIRVFTDSDSDSVLSALSALRLHSYEILASSSCPLKSCSECNLMIFSFVREYISVF